LQVISIPKKRRGLCELFVSLKLLKKFDNKS